MTTLTKRRIVCIGYAPDTRADHDNKGLYVAQEFDGHEWHDISSAYQTRDEVLSELE